MKRCLWFILLIVQLYSVDCHKHPLVLEKVITKLFFQNHFIFPLYDTKPVSFATYSNNKDWQNVLSSSMWSDINRFEIVEIKNLIKNNQKSNFIFLEEQNQYCDYATNIYFINKSEFIKCCIENQSKFKSVLGNSFTPEVMLENLINGHKTFRKFLNFNEELFGIFLGYGAQNSLEFSSNKSGHPKDVPFLIFKNNRISLLSAEHSCIMKITPVQFAGIPGTKETLTLQHKYSESYEKLSLLYRQPNSYSEIFKKLDLNP